MKSKLSSFKTILLSLVVMALWGSLFPCVKIGYKAFSISGTDISDILMFAGTRFTLCGFIISSIALCRKDKIEKPKIFISYAWGNSEYQSRVLSFATDLINDGIDVILDKWERLFASLFPAD